jgi:hypothetical protein
LAAIANTHAKAAANPKAQRPAYGPNGPVSAPLVVNAAKPYSFAYEVVDPAGNFFEIDSHVKLLFLSSPSASLSLRTSGASNFI